MEAQGVKKDQQHTADEYILLEAKSPHVVDGRRQDVHFEQDDGGEHSPDSLMDPEDAIEICHIYKYIYVGLHGTSTTTQGTICFIEKMQEPDTHNCRPIIFVSRTVTPEHGQWTLTRDCTELILNFNARFGQSCFEDPPLWPVRLLRHSDAATYVWQGYDRKGKRIVLEHLSSVKRGAMGWWSFAGTLH